MYTLTASQNNGEQEEVPGKETSANPDRIWLWWLGLPPLYADWWTYHGHFHPDVSTSSPERLLLPGLSITRVYDRSKVPPWKGSSLCPLTKGFGPGLSMATPVRGLCETWVKLQRPRGNLGAQALQYGCGFSEPSHHQTGI